MTAGSPFSSGSTGLPPEKGKPKSHVPASALLYKEIRNRIVSLELLPDTTLARAELAERYSVSQLPVREAIMRLENDGLVVSYPQSRTVVTRIDMDRLREEHLLRMAVECEVVRRLAETGDGTTVIKARGFVKMQEALVDDLEQIQLFKQMDDAFHEALFEGIGQLGLHAHVAARCGNMARLRSLDLPRTGKARNVLDGHRAVLEAIEAGDGAAAAEAMRRHLSGTMERLPLIAKEHRDLFS